MSAARAGGALSFPDHAADREEREPHRRGAAGRRSPPSPGKARSRGFSATYCSCRTSRTKASSPRPSCRAWACARRRPCSTQICAAGHIPVPPFLAAAAAVVAGVAVSLARLLGKCGPVDENGVPCVGNVQRAPRLLRLLRRCADADSDADVFSARRARVFFGDFGNTLWSVYQGVLGVVGLAALPQGGPAEPPARGRGGEAGRAPRAGRGMRGRGARGSRAAQPAAAGAGGAAWGRLSAVDGDAAVHDDARRAARGELLAAGDARGSERLVAVAGDARERADGDLRVPCTQRGAIWVTGSTGLRARGLGRDALAVPGHGRRDGHALHRPGSPSARSRRRSSCTSPRCGWWTASQRSPRGTTPAGGSRHGTSRAAPARAAHGDQKKPEKSRGGGAPTRRKT